MNFTVRVGNYILYPAFFILILVIFILFLAGVFIFIRIKENREEHAADGNYRITEWQRKHLGILCRNYVKDNELSEGYMDSIEKLEKYMFDSTYWNLDEMLEIDSELIKDVTTVIFLAAQESYLLQQEDDAVLLLHALDIINGGPDSPDYIGGEYPWIGEDVPEMKNHQDMSEEEARTLSMWFSSMTTLISFVDEDLGKIPETLQVPDYCKRITQAEMENCMNDLLTIVDIRSLKPENNDVVCKAMFLNSLIILNGIFNNDEEDGDKEDILYVDEYRRYTIRCLVAAIDNQLYSDVIASIDD